MKEEKLSNLKMGDLRCVNSDQRVPLYFIEKKNGDRVRLQDVIAYLAFKLSDEIVSTFEEGRNYEEGRDEKGIAHALEVLINAYKTGLF